MRRHRADFPRRREPEITIRNVFCTRYGAEVHVFCDDLQDFECGDDSRGVVDIRAVPGAGDEHRLNPVLNACLHGTGYQYAISAAMTPLAHARRHIAFAPL